MPSTARKVVTIGLGPSASGVLAAAISARACQSASTATGGTNTTRMASTVVSAIAAETADSNCSSDAPAPRSMVSRTSRPPLRAVSAARLPSTEELPMIRTRGPRGNGWNAKTVAQSNNSGMVSTWITPACSSTIRAI